MFAGEEFGRVCGGSTTAYRRTQGLVGARNKSSLIISMFLSICLQPPHLSVAWSLSFVALREEKLKSSVFCARSLSAFWGLSADEIISHPLSVF